MGPETYNSLWKLMEPCGNWNLWKPQAIMVPYNNLWELVGLYKNL